MKQDFVLIIEIMCHSHWLCELFQVNWCLHISKHILRPIIIIIAYSSIRLISSLLAMDMSENISDNPSSS